MLLISIINAAKLSFKSKLWLLCLNSNPFAQVIQSQTAYLIRLFLQWSEVNKIIVLVHSKQIYLWFLMTSTDLAFWLLTKQKTWKSPVSPSLNITNSPAEWALRLIYQCKIIIQINDVGFKNENNPGRSTPYPLVSFNQRCQTADPHIASSPIKKHINYLSPYHLAHPPPRPCLWECLVTNN